MTPLMLFDADCGLCTAAAGLAPRLRLHLRVEAMQNVDLVSLGVDSERAAFEMPLVRADHSIVYGHEAVAAALQTGIPPLRLVGALMVARPTRGLFARLYRWVARHRHELPGGTTACLLPPEKAVQSSSQ